MCLALLLASAAGAWGGAEATAGAGVPQEIEAESQPSRAAALGEGSPTDPDSLALRFAPRLYLQGEEPFGLVAVIPVLHPQRPIVAYHLFFAEDALFAGRGKSSDHEIVWVEYDPVTLEVADVRTLWHRIVLRTDECVQEARSAQRKPRVDVQWGQHGMLPFGWRAHPSVWSRLLLRVHYGLVRYVSRIPGVNARGFRVRFHGNYADYTRFTRVVDTAELVEKQRVVVAEHSARELSRRLDRTFKIKREWPGR